MITLFADILVIAGVGVLASALIPVWQLILQLPLGQLRRRWYILTGLIILFIAGYMGYVVAFWSHHSVWIDLIVPGVFFLGAGFVWLTATLSFQTATNVRRMTLLEHENITDPLIGIYNRRYLDRRLKVEFDRARYYGSPLSLLLIDIDHFKRVNDIYGHQVGDIVLRDLGRLLLQAIRDSDIAARYGGDEILIIAPNTNMALALTLAERLRQNVEAYQLLPVNVFNKPHETRITVSIGVADLSQETNDSQSLLLNADNVLYRAKKEGRNRVAIHGVEGQKPSPLLWE